MTEIGEHDQKIDNDEHKHGEYCSNKRTTLSLRLRIQLYFNVSLLTCKL